jgi:hypothetical protein
LPVDIITGVRAASTASPDIASASSRAFKAAKAIVTVGGMRLAHSAR